MNDARRPVTVHDVLRFAMSDDPQVSPDGGRVAWVRTRMVADENRYRSVIVITDVDGGGARDLVDGTHPRWSPDGRRLAYLAPDPEAAPLAGPAAAESPLDRLAQLWTIDPAGGEGVRLTSLRGGVAAPVWSPDGARLAFTTLVHPRRGLEEGPPAQAEDPYVRFNRDVLVVTRVRWKSDALGLLGDYVRQLATIEASPGAPVRLLTNAPHDVGAPAWSPDGATLAVAGNLGPKGDQERRAAIYLIDAAPAAGAEPVAAPPPLFWLAEMRGADVAWSPDGQRIAVCGHDDAPKGHYGFQKLWLVDVASGRGSCVSAAHDVSLGDYSRNQDMRRYGGPDGPRWLPDGRALLVLTNVRGAVNLSRFDLDDGGLRPVTEGDHSVCAFTLSADGRRVAYVVGDHVTPGDVWTLDLADGTPRRLSDVNAELRAEVRLLEPERFVARGSGVEVEGWVLLPHDLGPDERCPVILYTGGGPGGMRSSVFTHEWQLYAASGYAVIHCNARGNYGYGEAFSDATRGAWGDLDYQDNMAFLHEVVAAHPAIDGERMAVAGGSYGGYMAGWIAARHPEFRAAVVDRCLFNRYAFGGTSDIGMMLDHIEFGGKNPWEAPDDYLKWSPISYVDGIRTPTLVVHSALDYRCPIDQGEQLYAALQVLGVPTELVRFPDETHELSRAGRPWHRVYRLERYLDWFERYL
jgi:dipeptidyl aminopeptidase/acylaminoacyl peptidase